MKELRTIKCLSALAVCAFLASAVTGSANTISFLFNSPTGTLGTSQSYTVSGLTVTAYGYDSSGPSALFGKNDGGDEVGLGLANDPNGNGEIINGSFVQIDILQLQLNGYTSGLIFIGSTQGTSEPWDLFASNTLGTAGAVVITGNTTDYPNGVDVTPWLSYRYLSVSANITGGGNQNVLFSGISATSSNKQVPDSGTTVGLLSIGLAIILVSRRQIENAARNGAG